MIPLTPAQHRLWFIERAGGDGDYRTSAVHRLTGPFDEQAMRAALRLVLSRHDALRLSITERDGVPVQTDSGDATPYLEVLEVADEEHGLALAEAAVRRNVALDEPPLLRVTVVRTGERTQLVALLTHHIVCDGPSLAVVTDELYAAYRGEELAPTGLSFADYALARRPVGEEDRAYWRERLAGVPVLVPLSGDRRPGAAKAGARHDLHIPQKLGRAVRELARQSRCTPFMVLLTALKVLLLRHTGQQDVVVGSPVADRADERLERTVGMFVNTLALRTDLSGSPTLAQALSRVRAGTAGDLAHARHPFDQVVAEVRPGPLFQVMIAFAGEGEDTGGAEYVPLAPPAWFDLTLLVFAGRSLQASLDYDAGMFTPQTVRRYGEQLVALLTAMTASPELGVWEVPLLTTAERLAITTGGESFSSGRPVHRLIEDRACQAPDDPAVLDGADTLTYRRLDRRANHLAARLSALGVGRGSRVAVLLPTGADALVAILGVLKAGCAYVPLDPAHPADRLRPMLADAAAVVTAPGTLDGENVVELDGGEAGRAPEVRTRPDDAAYVIYTSGSTGEPKGVVVTHRNLAALTESFRAAHTCFEPGQRVLMLPPLTFDASVGDVFPALAGGAALVLHREPAALSGPDLVAFCAAHGVTAVDTASALWQKWTADLAGTVVPADWPVREVMAGGESVPMATLGAWARITRGRVTFYQHYGPTEATVCATVHRTVDGGESGDPANLPIGLPLPHVRAYVVDGSGGLAPTGAWGELCLAGDCVAQGYLGDPELTARRFVPDPFAGGRMYLTGDLARYRPDGRLEFLGRTDRQLKIRGHRIEPAEVEAVVAACPGVREVAVVQRDHRLVAYLTRDGGPLADPRAFTRARLPEPMVPGVFVELERLPLTPHAKIDYAALPAPVTQAAGQEPPSGVVEERLAAIWAEVLGVARVGRHDGFFALGGHSLLAGPVVARIRRELGVDLPLRAVLETADLADLARTVSEGGQQRDEVPDLRAQAVLPPGVCDEVVGAPGPGPVLLTGATGFLGAYLLDALLRGGAERVICLARAGDDREAVSRVRDNLGRFGLWRPEFAARIEGLAGDLTAQRLGLDAGRFDALAGELGLICHNGGAVSFAQPYERLRPANVGGTLEVLRLAGRARPVPVHVVSTLGVFMNEAWRGKTVTEVDQPDDPDGLHGGYNHSKWVADRVARLARERGLPLAVHRPARVTGDSRTGRSVREDHFSRLLTTFAQAGMVPDLPHSEDLAPVDYVAGAIAHLALSGRHGSDFHYFNSATMTYPQIAGVLDVPVVPWEQWRDTVLDAGPRMAIAPFADWLTERAPVVERPDFDCSATERAVAEAGIVCPPADAGLLARYLDGLA